MARWICGTPCMYISEINLSISRENHVISVSLFFKSGIIPDRAQYYRVNRVSRIAFLFFCRKRNKHIGPFINERYFVMHSLERDSFYYIFLLIHVSTGILMALLRSFTSFLNFSFKIRSIAFDRLSTSTSSRRILSAIRRTRIANCDIDALMEVSCSSLLKRRDAKYNIKSRLIVRLYVYIHTQRIYSYFFPYIRCRCRAFSIVLNQSE